MTTTAPFGCWASPIVPELLTNGLPGYAFPQFDNGNLYWLETRPWENGRSVVVRRRADGAIEDAFPAPLSCRSKVHEYGGSPYIVSGNVMYFCLYDDQRVYALTLDDPEALPQPITPDAKYCFADFCVDQTRQRLICVMEDHSQSGEPQNLVAAIPLSGDMALQRLCEGEDFYAYPKLDNNGQQLCWISWNHPDMPWDNTRLWLSTLDNDGLPGTPELIAGQGDESVTQPRWSPDNHLHFVSDRNNWWNLYRLGDTHQIEALLPMSAEFATPLWTLGMSNYDFLGDGAILCSYTADGSWFLATLSPDSQTLKPVETLYTQISDIYCQGECGWLVGAAPQLSAELAQWTTDDRNLTTVARGEPLGIDDGFLSRPQPISFPSGDNAVAHGFYYPPSNPDYTAPENSKPPLIVVCHGGPTGATGTSLNLKLQYWTSRGFAVLDVNYRGSTGYGRDYRHALDGQWGIVDVEDVVAGTRYLIDQQLVDRKKVAIRGSSAGGYTVLAALCFEDIFRAGACLYGIGDLETLARDTHKFESHYLERLVGPYPEQQETYRARSPIHHVDRFDCPVIFFQGLDDRVVPPEQALTMVKALRQKQMAVAYLPFEGESHGFRKAETIKTALEAELYFYGRVFRFKPADQLPITPIFNIGL
ncbi:S9 family peptidase [Porticoccus litoralis]|uniref:S9 family peptidase n=1 Tax=Porticoccus litoralis TaxID=434086 RepID=A0AAW8B5P9_9GAMM|nr:S9 family peptidase [Porticoccus litoralis]MDP1521245.1 S9 family peptidase [Porticoccus litoralis]